MLDRSASISRELRNDLELPLDCRSIRRTSALLDQESRCPLAHWHIDRMFSEALRSPPNDPGCGISRITVLKRCSERQLPVFVSVSGRHEQITMESLAGRVGIGLQGEFDVAGPSVDTT